MVFDWIVHRIRRSLEPDGVNPSSLPHIGVLDIFGFESFAENGLEQLLINYGIPSPHIAPSSRCSSSLSSSDSLPLLSLPSFLLQRMNLCSSLSINQFSKQSKSCTLMRE
jgi:hypothetical protein